MSSTKQKQMKLSNWICLF